MLVPRERPSRRNPVLRPHGSAHISLTARRANKPDPPALELKEPALRRALGGCGLDKRQDISDVDATLFSSASRSTSPCATRRLARRARMRPRPPKRLGLEHELVVGGRAVHLDHVRARVAEQQLHELAARLALECGKAVRGEAPLRLRGSASRRDGRHREPPSGEAKASPSRRTARRRSSTRPWASAASASRSCSSRSMKSAARRGPRQSGASKSRASRVSARPAMSPYRSACP